MTEAFLSIALAASIFAGLAGVLNAEWDRTRCSVQAFESAHQRLVGSLSLRPSVRVSENETTVTAEARCGHAVERVELIKLEAAEW